MAILSFLPKNRPKWVVNVFFDFLPKLAYFNPIIYGGGKFTPPKLFYLRSSKPLTVWKNPQKNVNQLRLRIFCQISNLFEPFS